MAQPLHRSITKSLLRWYGRNARQLPWRRAPSPFAIWVSEVMLQQTQVAAVIPYYRRFLRAFPTFKRLADSPLEKVLELWSGLGYYRRARNLHAAAQIIARKFRGRFPEDYAAARSLPGVGDYTARAVLSIAFDQPFAVLDGNVARVVARLFALRGHIHQPAFRASINAELERLLSPRQPGQFNQAMMELGQRVCLPRAPRCPACPLEKWCEGLRSGRPERYPAPRPRRATESRHLAAAVIRRGGKAAMVRGLDEGLLPEMWNFPAAFGPTRSAALRHLHQKIRPLIGPRVKLGPPLAEIRHTITHRAIRVWLYAPKFIPSAGNLKSPPQSVKWIPLRRLAGRAVSQLARKIAARLPLNS